jgi:hypothetical protein
MFDRFDVRPVFRGHWKGLTLFNTSPRLPDWTARLTLAVPAILIVTCSLWRDWKLAAPAALLAGVSLLTGGTLSVFSHLSTLRLRLTDRLEQQALDIERDSLDESVAHLLTATLLCVADAATIVIGMNFGHDTKGSTVDGVWAALALGISSYIALLFVVLVPRLYSAYIEINQVPSYMDGFDRSTPRQ